MLLFSKNMTANTMKKKEAEEAKKPKVFCKNGQKLMGWLLFFLNNDAADGAVACLQCDLQVQKQFTLKVDTHG